jgi:hypothetical protein
MPTQFFEEKLSPQQALQQLQQYYNIVKQVDGSFMIHHNHFLAMQPQWQVWRDVYENFLHQNKL